MDICYMVEQYFAPKGSDKICVMTTRLACIELLRARIGEWNNNLSDGFQLGYVTLPVTDVEPDMDLDEFSP